MVLTFISLFIFSKNFLMSELLNLAPLKNLQKMDVSISYTLNPIPIFNVYKYL